MIISNSVLVSKVKSKIKELIISKRLSIYELAQKADLREACIRNWYTARNYTPSLEAIEKICKALEISVFELFCDGEDVIPVNHENMLLLKKMQKLNAIQKNAVMIHIESYIN